MTFIAYYQSPQASSSRAKGQFEFESSARLNSKQLRQDARMAMLTRFGNEALSWNVMRIEKKKNSCKQADGQLELDFRPPKQQRKRRISKGYW